LLILATILIAVSALRLKKTSASAGVQLQREFLEFSFLNPEKPNAKLTILDDGFVFAVITA
jgi:hypothetical protein